MLGSKRDAISPEGAATASMVRDSGLSAEDLVELQQAETRVNDENEKAVREKHERDQATVQQSLHDVESLDEEARRSHCMKKHNELDTFLAGAAQMANFVRTQVATASSVMRVATDGSEAPVKGKKRGANSGVGGKSGKKKRKGQDGDPSEDVDGMLEVRQPKSITGGTLRDYQLAGVAWLLSVDMNGFNGILADEMGLGKTIQLISFYAALREQGVEGPLLVVAPLSTVPNWMREFKKWWPSQNVCMYHGSKEKRAEMRAPGGPMDRTRQNEMDFPVVITTYEVIIKDAPVLGRGRYQWKYLSVDEGHRLKNKDCLLISKLSEYSSDRRVLLTGTPLQNNMSELWSLLNFLMKDQFMDSETFLRHFELDDLVDDEQAMVRRQKRNDVLTKLHNVLRPYMLRRLKGDVDIGIPPKREVVVYCPMTKMQRELYQHAIDGTLAKTVKERQGSGVVDVRNSSSLQNKLMQLRKICNHTFLIEDHTLTGTTNENIVKFSGKMQVLDKMLRKLKADGHKVLLFSQWTRTLDILEDYFVLRGWATRILSGATNVMDRMQFVSAHRNCAAPARSSYAAPRHLTFLSPSFVSLLRWTSSIVTLTSSPSCSARAPEASASTSSRRIQSSFSTRTGTPLRTCRQWTAVTASARRSPWRCTGSSRKTRPRIRSFAPLATSASSSSQSLPGAITKSTLLK